MTAVSFDLSGKRVLITGSAIRVGKAMALAIARAGGEPIVHYRSSDDEARQTQAEIEALGATCHLLQADLSDPEAAAALIPRALATGPLYGLINNASVYGPAGLAETTLAEWQLNMNLHATAAFLLSQAFAKAGGADGHGRIVNMLDWQALRPQAHHFAYMISKAALWALTRSLAQALAPAISVNGVALGAILPASSGDGDETLPPHIPAGRWADLSEVTDTVLFLLGGPAYINGEVIHIDGGRHTV